MNDEKRVSVSEFKNWLSGVLDFQPDDWVPNEQQWAKIRNKIDQLDDTPTVVSRPTSVASIPNTRATPVQSEKSSVPIPDLDQPPVKLPDAARKKQQHVRVKQSSSPRVIEGEDGSEKIFDTGKMHEMGVIDTSEKTYESSFV